MVAGVVKIDKDRRSICQIPKTTFVRSDWNTLVAAVGRVVGTVRLAHADICESDEHVRVCITVHNGVCFDNGPQVSLDELVVRVCMLFDEALDFKKRWEEVPFISGSIDWIREAFAIVEWLHQGVHVVGAMMVTSPRRPLGSICGGP